MSLSGSILLPYSVFLLIFSGAFFCLLLGSFGGVGARTLGPVLAYSSVQHIGYVLALLAVSYGSVKALSWVLFYLSLYVLTMLLLSFVLLRLTTHRGGLSRACSPLSSGLVAVSIFSLAGCPPFVGFFSKFCAFLLVCSLPAYFLATGLVLSAVISTVYYGRIALGSVLSF